MEPRIEQGESSRTKAWRVYMSKYRKHRCLLHPQLQKYHFSSLLLIFSSSYSHLTFSTLRPLYTIGWKHIQVQRQGMQRYSLGQSGIKCSSAAAALQEKQGPCKRHNLQLFISEAVASTSCHYKREAGYKSLACIDAVLFRKH